MTKEEHNCDNVNCNHNNTKGLCCLFNPDDCKYRQLEKENAELSNRNQELLESCEGATMMYKDLCKAKEIIQKLIANAPNTYSGTDVELQQKKMFSFQDAANKAEQFLSEVDK